ncbi:hypothetical protein WIW49_04600 [Xanthomonas euroxanthea]
MDVTGGAAGAADSPALHALTASSAGRRALRNAGNLRKEKQERAIATSLDNGWRQVRAWALDDERRPPVLLWRSVKAPSAGH